MIADKYFVTTVETYHLQVSCLNTQDSLTENVPFHKLLCYVTGHILGILLSCWKAFLIRCRLVLNLSRSIQHTPAWLRTPFGQRHTRALLWKVTRTCYLVLDTNVFGSVYVLTKDMQAARRSILTSRSSNCSTTSSHRDLPNRDKFWIWIHNFFFDKLILQWSRLTCIDVRMYWVFAPTFLSRQFCGSSTRHQTGYRERKTCDILHMGFWSFCDIHSRRNCLNVPFFKVSDCYPVISESISPTRIR